MFVRFDRTTFLKTAVCYYIKPAIHITPSPRVKRYEYKTNMVWLFYYEIVAGYKLFSFEEKPFQESNTAVVCNDKNTPSQNSF